MLLTWWECCLLKNAPKELPSDSLPKSDPQKRCLCQLWGSLTDPESVAIKSFYQVYILFYNTALQCAFHKPAIQIVTNQKVFP